MIVNCSQSNETSANERSKDSSSAKDQQGSSNTETNKVSQIQIDRSSAVEWKV